MSHAALCVSSHSACQESERDREGILFYIFPALHLTLDSAGD